MCAKRRFIHPSFVSLQRLTQEIIRFPLSTQKASTQRSNRQIYSFCATQSNNCTKRPNITQHNTTCKQCVSAWSQRPNTTTRRKSFLHGRTGQTIFAITITITILPTTRRERATRRLSATARGSAPAATDAACRRGSCMRRRRGAGIKWASIRMKNIL